MVKPPHRKSSPSQYATSDPYQPRVSVRSTFVSGCVASIARLVWHFGSGKGGSPGTARMCDGGLISRNSTPPNPGQPIPMSMPT